jgi:hypothetical protein
MNHFQELSIPAYINLHHLYGFKKKKTTKKALNFFKAFQNPGWLTGFEPATLGTTNQYSNQLSYNHHFSLRLQIYNKGLLPQIKK